MIKKISIGVGVIVAGILIFAAFKSAEMKVSRETVIAASPEELCP
jgi:hypothetical protein